MTVPSQAASANGGSPRRVLVTGCAGFLGSHLAERLLADGLHVRGIDCFTDFYPRKLKEANVAGLLRNPAFELHERDISRDQIDDLVEEASVVYHLSAQAGVRGSFGDGFETYLRHNVRATQRLLESAVRHPVEAIVYASSSSVYGNAVSQPTPETAMRAPVSPYGMTKCATEDLAGVYGRNHGLHLVGLRYFTVYGPRQRPDMAFARFIAAANAGEPITVLGDGLQVRDFTYVDDVVDATVRAAERGTADTVYNIGGGTPVTLIDAIRMIEEKIGRPIQIDYRHQARGDARHTSADTSRAREELGFSPSVSLEEGLGRQVEWIARGARAKAGVA
ncbi:MAG: NAD-dependent epimerase/dehydratase family protein [Chloroflexota bacterium]